MLKALIVGVILGAALVLGGVWLYFTSGRAPVAVTDPPLPFEKKLAHASLNAHLDKQQRSEPAVPADETNFLAGAEVYKHNCAVCHGLPGVAPTAISEGEYPKPPELFKGTGVTDDPAWETYWKAANGIRLTGMPGFKGRQRRQNLPSGQSRPDHSLREHHSPTSHRCGPDKITNEQSRIRKLSLDVPLSRCSGGARLPRIAKGSERRLQQKLCGRIATLLNPAPSSTDPHFANAETSKPNPP
jgi:thiosulfate dehydrogenase